MNSIIFVLPASMIQKCSWSKFASAYSENIAHIYEVNKTHFANHYVNGSQLAKIKKYIPYMSLPLNL